MKPVTIGLGTFEIQSDRLIVSDPCYDRGDWCCGELRGPRQGFWSAAVVVRHEFDGKYDLGRRVVGLTTWIGAKPSQRAWAPAPFSVGVDSGQAGVFDARHYRDAELGARTPLLRPPYFSDNPWYLLCCDRTLNTDCDAGVIPYGVVSRSGFGDGCYSCDIRLEAGAVTAVRIVFV